MHKENDNGEMKNRYGQYDESTVFSDDLQDKLFKIEADSWWFQYRAKVITGLMKQHYDMNVMTVDIGGGNGYTTAVAKRKGYNMGLLEPSEGACANARKRGIDAHAGMMTEQYPDDGSYHQALLLDVLEHIEDDEGFLRLLNRKMSDDATVLITVPAYMLLWSSEDDHADHFRRYTAPELEKKAHMAGFDTVYAGYFMQFLFLPILFVRVFLEKIGLLKRQDERTEEERAAVMDKQFRQKKKGIVSFVLGALERAEYRRIMSGRRQKFGASVIAVFRKRRA